MRVVVLKAFGPWRVGQEIPEMPANQARTLIDRGMVRAEGMDAPRSLFSAARDYVDRQLLPRGRKRAG